MSPKRIALLLAFLVLTTLPAMAQTTANLTGTVTADGAPIPGVLVTITSPKKGQRLQPEQFDPPAVYAAASIYRPRVPARADLLAYGRRGDQRSDSPAAPSSSSAARKTAWFVTSLLPGLRPRREPRFA